MTSGEAINILASRVCGCGQPKVRKTAFWRRVGKGFEEAYEAAAGYLWPGRA
jgi:hypothetical protein